MPKTKDGGFLLDDSELAPYGRIGNRSQKGNRPSTVDHKTTNNQKAKKVKNSKK